MAAAAAIEGCCGYEPGEATELGRWPFDVSHVVAAAVAAAEPGCHSGLIGGVT